CKRVLKINHGGRVSDLHPRIGVCEAGCAFKNVRDAGRWPGNDESVSRESQAQSWWRGGFEPRKPGCGAFLAAPVPGEGVEGHVPGCNGGLNVTTERPQGVNQLESTVGDRGMHKILVAIAPPEGNQRRRASGDDIQSSEGIALQNFIPLKVLDYSAVLDFDSI